MDVARKSLRRPHRSQLRRWHIVALVAVAGIAAEGALGERALAPAGKELVAPLVGTWHLHVDPAARRLRSLDADMFFGPEAPSTAEALSAGEAPVFGPEPGTRIRIDITHRGSIDWTRITGPNSERARGKARASSRGLHLDGAIFATDTPKNFTLSFLGLTYDLHVSDLELDRRGRARSFTSRTWTRRGWLERHWRRTPDPLVQREDPAPARLAQR